MPNVHGFNLEPGEYRRVSANGRRGDAYLVVRDNGTSRYVNRRGEPTAPAAKNQVEYIFNQRYPGTSVVRTPLG